MSPTTRRVACLLDDVGRELSFVSAIMIQSPELAEAQDHSLRIIINGAVRRANEVIALLEMQPS